MATGHLHIEAAPDTIVTLPSDARSRPTLIHIGAMTVGSAAGPTKTLQMSNDVSDISGYRILQTGGLHDDDVEYTASCTPVLTCESLIEEFATNAGAMDEVVCTGITATWQFGAYYSASDLETIRRIIGRMYHRAVDGTETLISEISQDITTTLTSYTKTSTVTSAWATNERVVIKWYAYFEVEV